MASKRGKAVAGYKAAHANMKSMSEQQLREAIQAEIDRGVEARPDLLSRLVGKLNRVVGSRRMRDILSLLGKRGKHDVNQVLDGIR